MIPTKLRVIASQLDRVVRGLSNVPPERPFAEEVFATLFAEGPEAAHRVLQGILEIVPQDGFQARYGRPRASDLFQLGHLSMLAQRTHDAVAYRQLGTLLEPEAAYLHTWLGRALIEAARPDEALAPLEHALELDPEDRTCLRTLAELRDARDPR